MEGIIGVNKGIQKGVEKAEALKRSEMPPLLQALDYVNEHLDVWLAARQEKEEPAPSVAQGVEDFGSEDGQWGQWAIRSAPSKQFEYERYVRERNGQKSAASPPPPPPPPGFRNFDMGNGKIIHVRITPEPTS